MAYRIDIIPTSVMVSLRVSFRNVWSHARRSGCGSRSHASVQRTPASRYAQRPEGSICFFSHSTHSAAVRSFGFLRAMRCPVLGLLGGHLFRGLLSGRQVGLGHGRERREHVPLRRSKAQGVVQYPGVRAVELLVAFRQRRWPEPPGSQGPAWSPPGCGRTETSPAPSRFPRDPPRTGRPGPRR